MKHCIEHIINYSIWIAPCNVFQKHYKEERVIQNDFQRQLGVRPYIVKHTNKSNCNDCLYFRM